MSAAYIAGDHPERGRLIACIDGSARFTAGEVRASKLSALLAPFPDKDSALAALLDAGAVPEVGAL
jgi:hypothetical protein